MEEASGWVGGREGGEMESGRGEGSKLESELGVRGYCSRCESHTSICLDKG